MFSSGSQVLYLPGGTATRVRAELTSPRSPAPPQPAAPHSLDGPALPFHQVLDAALQNTRRRRGGETGG